MIDANGGLNANVLTGNGRWINVANHLLPQIHNQVLYLN